MLAQLGIVVSLGGIPWALYTLAGNPLPERVPTWSRLGELLTARDDGSLFLGAITWAGWIGWVSFALPLAVEIICHLSRWRPPRILGLVWQQRRAAALVAAALSVGASPAMASASAVVVAPFAAGVAPNAATLQFGPDGRITSRISAGSMTLSSSATHQYTEPVYVIARDDWLYHVAARFLGDGDRYADIARLNPGLEHADRRFPNHIEPGQRLRLPAEAHDRGPRPHAVGRILTPATPSANEDHGTSPPGPAPTPTTPSTPTPTTPSTPTPTATATASPTASATSPSASTPTRHGASPAQNPAPRDDSSDSTDYSYVDAALPITAALATAGLLAALLLYQLSQRRRRQRRYRRPGRRIPQPPSPVAEQRVRAAAQPLDVDRLDHALRTLAAALRERGPQDLPDLAAAWLSGGEVHLMLAEANGAAPPPFEAKAQGMTWRLPSDAVLPDVDDTLAPLPTLVTVASRPGGDHILIDLERTGFLSLGGDPGSATDLLRYLAAELATNQWSDDAEVVLAGFDPVDAESLIALGGDRIKAADSAKTAVDRARRRVAANAAAMNDTGVPSAFAGRVADIVADAWMPHVLLVAGAADIDDQLRELAAELRLAGRCGVAVAAISENSTTWRLEVTTDGKLAIDWLSISNTTATRLPREQLTRLAPVMRAARAAAPTADLPADEAVPPAPEPDPWAEGADAHGHLLRPADDPAAVGSNGSGKDAQNNSRAGRQDGSAPASEQGSPAVPEPDRRAPAPAEALSSIQLPDAAPFTMIKAATVGPSPRTREPHDPELDADLDAWSRPDPFRPRIALLGPVVVEAPGEPPEERIRFYSELVVYLAQRGRAGATGEQIDDALWPERGVNARSRRVAISKVRRWLGEDANGEHWLPPNIGADRLYRLAPGILIDWQLFRRLRARGEAKGTAGVEDLRRALELVRGEPLAGAELPYSSGYRNPFTWLPGSDVQPHNLSSAIVDTAHQLADLYLDGGDIAGARWAVERAWLADAAHLDDHPWIDAMRVAHADGRAAELRALLDDLVRTREVEVPEDLPPETYAAINGLMGNLLRVG